MNRLDEFLQAVESQLPDDAVSLAAVERRAGELRRRRTAQVAAVALLAVLAAGAGIAAFADRRAEVTFPPADRPGPGGVRSEAAVDPPALPAAPAAAPATSDLASCDRGTAGPADCVDWQVRMDGATPSAVSAPAGGTVFVGSTVKGGGGGLHALDERDGTPRWEVGLPAGVLAAPALADGRVYVADAGPPGAPAAPATPGDPAGSTVFALDARTGELLWRRTLSGRVTEQGPLPAEGVVVVAANPEPVALDARTGEVVRTLEASGQVTSATVDDGVLYYADGGGTVRAVDLRDEGRGWEVGGGAYVAARVLAGVVFAIGLDGEATALRAADGSAVWSATLTGGFHSAPVADDLRGVLYLRSDGGEIVTLDARSGGSLPTWIPEPAPAGAPVVLEAALALPTAEGLTLVEPVSGTAIATVSAPPAQEAGGPARAAATADGRVLFTSSAGLLAVSPPPP